MISTASTFEGSDKEVASGLRMAKEKIYEMAVEQQGLHQELAAAGWTEESEVLRLNVDECVEAVINQTAAVIKESIEMINSSECANEKQVS